MSRQKAENSKHEKVVSVRILGEDIALLERLVAHYRQQGKRSTGAEYSESDCVRLALRDAAARLQAPPAPVADGLEQPKE